MKIYKRDFLSALEIDPDKCIYIYIHGHTNYLDVNIDIRTFDKKQIAKCWFETFHCDSNEMDPLLFTIDCSDFSDFTEVMIGISIINGDSFTREDHRKTFLSEAPSPEYHFFVGSN